LAATTPSGGVRRRAQVDQLERGAVRGDLPVRADLDCDLGVGVEVLALRRAVRRPRLEAGRRGQVAHGEVVADPLAVADPELPADALARARAQLALERGDETRVDPVHAREFRRCARSAVELHAIGMLNA
jgi:hypothetical protein